MQRIHSRKDKRLSKDKSPVKNGVYCPHAQKRKLLFATKEKADRFIEFNADSIRQSEGYAPVRSYLCTACGGWHVTSQPRRGNNDKQ